MVFVESDWWKKNRNLKRFKSLVQIENFSLSNLLKEYHQLDLKIRVSKKTQKVITTSSETLKSVWTWFFVRKFWRIIDKEFVQLFCLEKNWRESCYSTHFQHIYLWIYWGIFVVVTRWGYGHRCGHEWLPNRWPQKSVVTETVVAINFPLSFIYQLVQTPKNFS